MTAPRRDPARPAEIPPAAPVQTGAASSERPSDDDRQRIDRLWTWAIDTPMLFLVTVAITGILLGIVWCIVQWQGWL